MNMTRRALDISRQLALGVLAALLAACFATTPRPEDAHATREFYSAFGSGDAKCDRPVAVIPAGSAPGRPSRELANISTTCYPGTIWLCERRLKERACVLGADAVLLTDAESGPNPAGGSRQSAVTRSGRAIRWED